MDEQFWHRKWQRNEIGFHAPDFNPMLLRYWRTLALAQGVRVFVPLCGKTRDIHWLLAQGHRVVGAELSRTAVEQLFSDLGLTPAIDTSGTLTRFQAGDLTVFVGNIFDLDREMLGPVEAIYDRAALVALPTPLRERYTAHLTEITRKAPQLLVTLEYDATLIEGPPFSIPAQEVSRLYDTDYRIERLEQRDNGEKLKGICPTLESAWKLLPT